LLLKAPRLPRRLMATCARMNLNRLWGELEEIYRDRTSNTVLTMVEEEQQNRDNEERERIRSMATS
jgi:hypothetical protein